MYGDIVYVERRPALLGSIEKRSTEESGIIDKLIFRFGFYRHFGIEVENGNIIHFHSTSYHKRKEATIKKVTTEDFLAGGRLSVLRLVGSRYSRTDTVMRAYSALGEAQAPYSINRNNCEHFAMWCATGNYHSKQAYFFEKGHDVLLYPTKVSGKVISVVPFTMNMMGPLAGRTRAKTVQFGAYTKDRTMQFGAYTRDRTKQFGAYLYNRLLKRA